VRTSNFDVSPARTARLALTACVTAALLLALAAAGPIGDAHAALKYKQPACGKFQKQVRNSTGAKKRSAKAQLKQCQANAAAYKQIRNSHFYGYRADDVKIDTIYCGNGKWQDDVEDGGKVGTSGWRVVNAKVSKDGRQLTATVEAWIPGGKHVQGIIRNNDVWQVGYEFSGKINSAGTVEKRDARAACAAL
jgi:hypothetical protein